VKATSTDGPSDFDRLREDGRVPGKYRDDPGCESGKEMFPTNHLTQIHLAVSFPIKRSEAKLNLQ
jgi:hypothetical protein